MNIYNKEKSQILENPDLTLGYLQEDTITHHHEQVEAVEEQGHWETIAEYANGGKDVEWVVDVEGIEGKEAYDEVEDIYVYIPYTNTELAKINAEKRILQLKQYLIATDYIVLKIAEAETLSEQTSLREEYASVINERKSARATINELESLLQV